MASYEAENPALVSSKLRIRPCSLLPLFEANLVHEIFHLPGVSREKEAFSQADAKYANESD